MDHADAFLAQWADLGRSMPHSGDGSWAALGEALRARHDEPLRAYHGLRHVLAVLETMDLLDSDRGAEPALRLAAFFHDAIYDPTASNNEERSAVLAADDLGRLGVPNGIISDTARLIRATDWHQTDGTPSVSLFLDADLAILGTSPETYDRYATAIRSEYAHLADDVYRAGRAKVLQQFLDRPQLFFTEAGREQFEQQARLNLAREIGDLIGS